MTARLAVIRDEAKLSFGMLPQVLGYHLRRAQIAAFKHFARTVTAAEGITPGLFGMLQVIAANPGLAQNRLAEVMEVDRSAIFKVVNQLEGRGLIARTPSDHDRRSNCLTLTEGGLAALARMEALVVAHETEFAGPLSPDERATLTSLLQRLYRGQNDLPGGSRP
jgi:DNA-binding MarR family transcriptional regulator